MFPLAICYVNSMNRIVFALLCLGTAVTARAELSSFDVLISNAAGRAAFKGATNSAGVFATPKLAPGHYVVELKARELDAADYAIVVGAGRRKVVAIGVPRGKFSGGGVALKLDVDGSSKVMGQVVDGRNVGSTSDPNVKVINGNVFRWVNHEIGSNLGGHWVDVTTARSVAVQPIDPNYIRKIQDRAGEGSMLNTSRVGDLH